AQSELPSVLMDLLEAWHDVRRLERGDREVGAICRVVTLKSILGTGFLVTPGLLMTNNHVIGDEKQASDTRIRFEDDFEFELAHRTLFVTDRDIDVTFVAVASTSRGGDLLRTRPTLSLRTRPGIAIGDRVNIVAYTTDKSPVRSVGEVARIDDRFMLY